MELHRLSDLDDAALAELYAAQAESWLRVNMISTLDGSATDIEGRSGGINNAADQRVFALLRGMADCVVVGAGTARAERYTDLSKPLVLVSRGGGVPEQLRDAASGEVLMATFAAAEHLAEAKRVLGEENVLVLGQHRVDLAGLKQALVERGWTNILCEGGPHLLRDMLAEGVVDELCLTVVPRLLGGQHPRILGGPPIDVTARPALLLESDGTLLGRWLI